MSHKAVAIIVGTRPEVIKMAPVYFALQNHSSLRPLLVSTGQHRQMIDQAFAVFGLKPDIDLGLMQQNQTLPELSAKVITGVTAWLQAAKPAAVLLQGDTTTVLGAALAAFYQRVPIGHIEAGLRTYDFEAPWPEEMNRRLVAPISRWCFAPTEWSAQNLRNERIPSSSIHVTGNTVVDALLWMCARLQEQNVSAGEVSHRCSIPREFVQKHLETTRAPWILVTGHRRESFGSGFENICRALAALVKRHPEVGVLYPVHLNPNVQEPVYRLIGKNPRIALVPPVHYQDFIWLMSRCHYVISDSGGVQEEAPSLGKPVLVMRDTTERPEGIEAGTCRLVGTDPEHILKEAGMLLGDSTEYARRSALRNPYGDGMAARRIVEVLARDLA